MTYDTKDKKVIMFELQIFVQLVNLDLLELLLSRLQRSGEGVEAELGLRLKIFKVFQNQLGKALALLFKLYQRRKI